MGKQAEMIFADASPIAPGSDPSLCLAQPQNRTDAKRRRSQQRRRHLFRLISRVTIALPISLLTDPTHNKTDVILSAQNTDFLELLEEFRHGDTLRRHSLAVSSKLLFCGPLWLWQDTHGGNFRKRDRASFFSLRGWTPSSPHFWVRRPPIFASFSRKLSGDLAYCSWMNLTRSRELGETALSTMKCAGWSTAC